MASLSTETMQIVAPRMKNLKILELRRFRASAPGTEGFEFLSEFTLESLTLIVVEFSCPEEQVAQCTAPLPLQFLQNLLYLEVVDGELAPEWGSAYQRYFC